MLEGSILLKALYESLKVLLDKLDKLVRSLHPDLSEMNLINLLKEIISRKIKKLEKSKIMSFKKYIKRGVI